MNSMHAAALVAAMSVMTILTRFLPFIVFRKNTPRYITYLGKVLPPAIIGMLVIYCLKDVSILSKPFGIPELIAAICVVGCGTAGLEEEFVDQYFDRNCGVYGAGADGVWVI